MSPSKLIPKVLRAGLLTWEGHRHIGWPPQSQPWISKHESHQRHTKTRLNCHAGMIGLQPERGIEKTWENSTSTTWWLTESLAKVKEGKNTLFAPALGFDHPAWQRPAPGDESSSSYKWFFSEFVDIPIDSLQIDMRNSSIKIHNIQYFLGCSGLSAYGFITTVDLGGAKRWVRNRSRLWFLRSHTTCLMRPFHA